MLNHLEFANPEYFYLFLLIPALIFWYWLRRKRAYPYLIFFEYRTIRKKRQKSESKNDVSSIPFQINYS